MISHHDFDLPYVTLHSMIGPHEGKELELMLKGDKKLAAFGDVLSAGEEISEEIIPEQAFSPYVQSQQIKRFERIFQPADSDNLIKNVCFTLPKEEWRADTYLWLRESVHTNQMPYDNSIDIIIGRLLGYSEEDIQEFVAKWS